MPNGSERYAPWPARLRGEGRARKTTARLCELSTDVREAPMAGGTLSRPTRCSTPRRHRTLRSCGQRLGWIVRQLEHGQAAELCLGNTAELGVTERGVEGERLFQIGDPEPEVQHAHARQTSPTTPPEVDAPASRSPCSTFVHHADVRRPLQRHPPAIHRDVGRILIQRAATPTRA
jgi:hypothetical protein